MSYNIKANERELLEKEAEEDAQDEEYFQERRHERHGHRHPKEPTWRIYFFIILAVSMATFGLTTYYYPELLGPRPTNAVQERLFTTPEIIPTVVTPQTYEQPTSTVDIVPAPVQSDQPWSFVALVIDGRLQTYITWLPDTSLNAPYLSDLPLSLPMTCPPEGLLSLDVPDTAITVYLTTSGYSVSTTVSVFPAESPFIAQVVWSCQPGDVFTVRW